MLVLAAADKVPVATEIAGRRAGRVLRPKPSTAPTGWPGSSDRAGVAAAAIHGDRNQNQRQRALDGFTAGHPRVLVATDVAARGIHVDDIDLVVHFDPPNDHKDYLHRGPDRAGGRHRHGRRAGRRGSGPRGGSGCTPTAAGTADRHQVAPGHEVVTGSRPPAPRFRRPYGFRRPAPTVPPSLTTAGLAAERPGSLGHDGAAGQPESPRPPRSTSSTSAGAAWDNGTTRDASSAREVSAPGGQQPDPGPQPGPGRHPDPGTAGRRTTASPVTPAVAGPVASPSVRAGARAPAAALDGPADRERPAGPRDAAPKVAKAPFTAF